MATANELRQILKEDAAGNNLYDHLTETLMRICLDRPGNAYDAFELISANIKANPLNPDPQAGQPVPPSAEETAKKIAWTNSSVSLLKVPEAPVEGGGCTYPDLMDEAALLEWAGVSFGKAETYRLYLAIKALAESLPGEAGRARFFGKITTRGKPYWVVEVLSTYEGEEADPTKVEGKEGGNKFQYYVSQAPDDKKSWVVLPQLTMAQVQTSRQFKRLLTGNLDAAVPTFPVFPGTERNLLRAIIGRIGGATSISPDGYYALDDEGEVKPAEAEDLAGAFPKDGEAMKDPEAWKHHECDLNALGRVKAMPEQLGEDGEPIVEDEPVEATPNLNGLTAENWSMRVGPGGAGVASTSGAIAKSLLWPGAVAVAAGRRYLNCYVGNGVMYDPKPYSPNLPKRTESEWAPGEEEAPLVETEDVRNDPTPPKSEEEPEE